MRNPYDPFKSRWLVKVQQGVAFKLVGQITKDNGTRFVQAVWDKTSTSVGNVVDSTVKGVKSATGKMVDNTLSTVNSMGRTLSTKVRGNKVDAKQVAAQEPIQ